VPEGSSDYINASLVRESRSGRDYILTQGPLDTTSADFWRVVWQQQVSVVVMLCKPRENGVEKCHVYWPDAEEEAVTCGDDLTVSYVGRDNRGSDFVKRQFKMVREQEGQEKEVRTIWHFQFLAWPDFGVPDTPAATLDFIDSVREARANAEGDAPVVVHCSAGIGELLSSLRWDRS